MIRLLGLGLLLWLLVGWHQPYRQRHVPKVLTGQEVLAGSGGLVTVTGVVNTIRDNDRGGLTLRLDCQGALVTLYSDALHRPIGLTQGRSVTVTGRRFNNGLLVLEDVKAIKPGPVLAQSDNGRLTLAVRHVYLLGRTRSGRYQKVAIVSDDGARSDRGLLPAELAEPFKTARISELYGYELPNKRFVIESWQ